MLRSLPISSRMVLYLVAVLIAALFLPSSVMAHKPIFIERSISGYEQALEIPDATVSYAMYSELQGPQQVDLYKFTLAADTPFYARISVPKRPELRDFAPAFVLFGPGLPTSNEPPHYPLALPEGLGRAILLPAGEKDDFYEPFTQTTMVQRQYISRQLPPGTYYLAVYSPAGQTGKYVLATGEREQFGFADWLLFPLTWLKVRLWYDATQTWLILAGIAAAIAGAIWYWRNRNKQA
ncbi:MAG: LPXTG cell wall anchor domain-containing protein [Tumebacillaceae bacterium]